MRSLVVILGALEKNVAIIRGPFADSVGLGLLQLEPNGGSIEGVLRKYLEVQFPNMNTRDAGYSTLRMWQAQIEQFMTAFHALSLVGLKEGIYRLTPDGLSLFKTLESERDEFERKFRVPDSDAGGNLLGATGNRRAFAIQSGVDNASEIPEGAPCPFALNAENIYLGECEQGEPITAGFRFTNLDFPPQTRVREAYMEFVSDGPYTNVISVSIHAEDTGNADAFSDGSRPSNRKLTQVAVPWRLNSREVWAIGQTHMSPDISPILEVIFARPDWQPGNAIAILVAGLPGGDPGTHRRVVGFTRAAVEPAYHPPRLILDCVMPPEASRGAGS